MRYAIILFSCFLFACAHKMPKASYTNQEICDLKTDSIYLVCKDMKAMCPKANNVSIDVETGLVSVYFGEYNKIRYVMSLPYDSCQFMLLQNI